MKASRSEFLPIRGLRYHVRHWGEPGAPLLFLLHGWMDVGASFQFVVDCLRRDWHVLAPDWRGFGRSAWRRDCYWFPEYLADLDALLDRFAPHDKVRLVGHSMGGNIACLYAGVRSERVERLVTIEGFGLAPLDPAQAPARYRRWLDELKGKPGLRSYTSREDLAQRLCRDNPRLDLERARFLAQHLGVPREDGGIDFAGDPWHRLVNPVLYRIEEAKACWREITAPVLWIAARESSVMKSFRGHEDEYRARLACLRELREVVIEDAGHMVHQERPQEVAQLIEEFLAPA